MEVRSAAVWRFELTMHKLLLALDQLLPSRNNLLHCKEVSAAPDNAGWVCQAFLLRAPGRSFALSLIVCRDSPETTVNCTLLTVWSLWLSMAE